MRVACPPTDPPAVYNLRTKWPGQALKDQGEIDLIELSDGLSLRQAMRRHGTAEVVGIRDLPELDVLVLTRVLAGRLVDAMELIQQQGIAVVVDIDDNFRHTPPGMDGRHKIDPQVSRLYNWKHLARACAKADLVTCSTEALTSYAPHGRVVVLNNCVPKHYTTAESQIRLEQLTVGWSGSVKHHPGDLEVTRGGVAQALHKTGSRFLVVGSVEGVQRGLGLPTEPNATGLVSHEVWPYKMAQLDVGIAPLTDNAYNRAKSWIAPLSMTALGIPWVSSPTTEYQRLYEQLLSADLEGLGALANPRSREWRRETLNALRTAENASQAKAGRDFVAENHTIEGQAWRWAEAWDQAVAFRKGKETNARAATR